MSALTINVIGTPAPQGSKRAFVVNGRAVMTESSKKVRPWRQDVTAAAQAATHETQGYEPYTGPVAVAVTFYLPRPQAHYRTGRRAGELKPNAPSFVATRPDLSKLVRSTEDALTTAGVYHDDAQVARLTVEKRYAVNGVTGARIFVQPIDPEQSAANGIGPEQETLL